jgi:outer membrane lipoprotein-sorting protein
MNCPEIDALWEVALELPPSANGAPLRQHAASCPRCGERSQRLGDLNQELARAHRLFGEGHDPSREQLLARLDERPSARADRGQRDFAFPTKRSLLMRRVSLGVVAAALVALLVVVLQVNGQLSAVAQVAKEFRQAKSYKCKLTRLVMADGQEAEDVGTLQWAAPGSVRQEINKDGKPVLIEIYPSGKPGIEIQPQGGTYRRLPARQGKPSQLLTLERLAQFSGKADRDLGKETIADKETRVFEIATHKIDSDAKSDGKLRVWADPATNRPVRIEIEHASGDTKFIFRFDDFAWDLPTDGWFDTAAPAGLEDQTPSPPKEAELVEQITTALRTYAKYNGGKYPQVNMVYGDVTRDELFKKAGVSRRPKTADEAKKPAYVECLAAVWGFSHISAIQRENADAAYFGKTVGPDDEDKVLFRWKLESGQYQVIFGDLRDETLDKEALAKREAKSTR